MRDSGLVARHLRHLCFVVMTCQVTGLSPAFEPVQVPLPDVKQQAGKRKAGGVAAGDFLGRMDKACKSTLPSLQRRPPSTSSGGPSQSSKPKDLLHDVVVEDDLVSLIGATKQEQWLFDLAGRALLHVSGRV